MSPKEILYHVTFAERLREIAKKGLRPDQKMTIPWKKPARENIKGRIFFSTSLHAAKIWGYYIPLAHWENFRGPTVPVPILLRAKYSGRLWHDVGFGIQDSVFGVEAIPAKDIELWDPVKLKWVSLDKTPKELVYDHFDVDPTNLYLSVPLFVDRVKRYVALEWPEK